MKIRNLAISVLLLTSISVSAQKFDGLADTPPMGWNTWNKFAGNINEELIRRTADAMVASGVRDAGYVYLNIDDCWHGQRDSLGFIQCDPERFPSGMKALTDYIHSRGLKAGIYSDAGRETCAGKPGSQGHEYQDALQYAMWGFDYLKYDWCATGTRDAQEAYTLMRDALHQAGRPILLSICEWGGHKPWLWAQDVGHCWRTTGDICNLFDGVKKFDTWQTDGVLQILDQQQGLRDYAGPGHWNDPDMLEVGNNLTENQGRAHFTMWCMLAAPLILGNDLTAMDEATRQTILNCEAIAIDQDPLGIQALRYKVIDGLEFWLKPLSAGAWAFCLLNRTTTPKTYDLQWGDFCLTDALSKRSTNFDTQCYNIHNVWSGKNEGTTSKPRQIHIPAQDVVLYRLTAK
ncbi:MAG: glycoside hydrolase family 27 protein [Alistipes sp.]